MLFGVYYLVNTTEKRDLYKEFQRILIVRTDRIGDVILTLPMIKVLKRQFPSVKISMLIRQYTAEIVKHHSHVDEMVFYDRHHQPVPFFHLLALLRSKKYDVVFHTHPRFRVALLTWLAGIPIRVGTGYRWYSFLFNKKIYQHRKDARYHELEYNLNLLEAIDCPVVGTDVTPAISVRPADAERVQQELIGLGVPADQRVVILHPGSGGSARDWSAEKFGELGGRLAGLDNTKVVVTGGKEEHDLVSRVCDKIGNSVTPLVDVFNLSEFAALAQRASLFIANSTGMIHVAAAVGTPVIGLYSQITPLSAARWGPYTKNKTIFSPVSMPVDCQKCDGRTLCECMESIPVDEVFQAAVRMLADHSAAEIKGSRKNVETL